MSLRDVAFFDFAAPSLADVRAKMALRRNRLYVKSEKLRALLSPGGAKKILFSEKPDWVDAIQSGFRRLPHQIEFGPITEDSFDRYDIVVPLTLSALEKAQRFRPLEKKALPLPTAESIRLCDDKYALNLALQKAGFGMHIPAMVKGLGLKPPYILKKRTGWWGVDCTILRDHEDEESCLDRITAPEYFCQEFIPGPTEFATHILFVSGRIVKALNIRYELSTTRRSKDKTSFFLKGFIVAPI